MDWAIWIAAGILCMVIEIFAPGFLFFSFGVGAITTGLAAVGLGSLQLQLAMFSVSTMISFLLMKRFAGTLLKKSENIESNVYALKDKLGTVTKIILPSKKGYVKIEGEEWSAVSSDSSETISEGNLVKILKIEGNKAIVSSHVEEA